MRIKSKNGLKVMSIAIALLLCLALAIGITGAFYQAKRQATGTLNMNQGIVIDYKGFGQPGEEGTKWERTAILPLFSITDAQPGAQIAVNPASIKAGANSVDFYARVKLSYKFSNGETVLYDSTATTGNVANFKPSDLIKTSTDFFGTNWVPSQNNDGYFYYGTGTTLNKFNKGTQTFVDLFATDAKFIIEGAGFIGGENNGEGGGFVVGNTSINKIEVFLTLETLQGDADAFKEGWSITKVGKVDLSGVTSDKTTIDIDELKPAINNKTEDIIVSAPPANIDKVTIRIGSRAFAGCPKLKLHLSDASNVEYIIASDAFEATAEVNYGARNIVNEIRGATSETQTLISGTQVYVYKPTTFNPTVAGNTSYGTYKYTDDQGTWYYDLIDSSGNTVTLSASGNKTVKIKFVDNNADLTTLKIPQYIQPSVNNENSERYLVTVLESYSYSPMIKNRNNLTSIKIPSSVTSIGDWAFYLCSKLESITIPDSVTSIKRAFERCSGLTEIKIPDSVTSIGNIAFEYCSGLKTIEVAQGNTKYSSVDREDKQVNCLIEKDTNTLILGCQNSEIPEGVTSIGNGAFYACKNLTQIIIPDSVTSIGSYAFYVCSLLKTVTIGSRVTAIPDYCFQACSLLETVVIKGNINIICSSAFENCSNLTSIVLPSSVETIQEGAFSGCSKLTTVYVNSNNATEITGLGFALVEDGKKYDYDENGNLIEKENGAYYKYIKPQQQA